MKKNKKIKFGLLGLGNVVQGRVKNLFTKELKNCSVKAVFDKDKKKIKEFSKYFNCSETSSEKLFFKQNFKTFFNSIIDKFIVRFDKPEFFKSVFHRSIDVKSISVTFKEWKTDSLLLRYTNES